MAEFIDSKVEETIQSLIKSAQLITQYGDEELRNPEPFSRMINTLTSIENNIIECANALQATNNVKTIAQFDEDFANKRSQSEESQSRLTTKYEEIRNEIAALLSGHLEDVVEDDDFVMALGVSELDPLTKLRMTHPLKNIICGHHYEKSTILQSIEVNARLRCPIAGCGNSQFLTKEHLVEDPVFRMKLSRSQNT